MARLCDVLTAKKGDWLSTADVIGLPLTVTEDVSMDAEIRRDDTDKYFCVQVTDGTRIRDLHIGKGALRALAAIMPASGSWRNKRFSVNSVTGKGFNTVTGMSLLRGDYDPAAQQRLTQPPAPAATAAAAETVPAVIPLPIRAVLMEMHEHPNGVHEMHFDEFVREALLRSGVIASVSETVALLKGSGHIKKDGVVWKVVS